LVGFVTASFALAENAVQPVGQEPAQLGVTQERPVGLQKRMLYDVALERLQPGASRAILVVPTAESIESTPEFVASATKDLNIMCRIFDKERGISPKAADQGQIFHDILLGMEGASSRQWVLPAGFSGPASRETRGMYLEGYGVVFLMKVDFQLTAPPHAEESDKPAEEDVDPVWRQIEQELYEPEKLKEKEKASGAKQYDEVKVEDFKAKLVRALKHAANIRSVKPDERIILTVRGPQPPMGPAEILSIRAKKSDVDAFAKGQLNLDQFREKVQILMYADYSVTTSSSDARGPLDVSTTRRSLY
jgi:hypothetical protein